MSDDTGPAQRLGNGEWALHDVDVPYVEDGGEPQVLSQTSSEAHGRGLCRHRCRARETTAEGAGTQRYRSLRCLAEELTEEELANFSSWARWSNSTTKQGARVFVLVTPGEDAGHVDMWRLCAYALGQMHEHVVLRNESFVVVWVQLNDHRIWPWSAWRFRGCLHQRFFDNCEAVHVVHPSWGIHVLRLLLWPVARDEYWDLFHAHERVEFLDSYLDVGGLELPEDVLEYDRFLDDRLQHEVAAMGIPVGSVVSYTPEHREE